MTVKDFLNNPKKWTQGANARNKLGEAVNIDSNDACSWCLSGAILACSPPHGLLRETLCVSILRSIKELYPNFDSIQGFNDHYNTTFEDVKKVLEHANV